MDANFRIRRLAYLSANQRKERDGYCLVISSGLPRVMPSGAAPASSAAPFPERNAAQHLKGHRLFAMRELPVAIPLMNLASSARRRSSRPPEACANPSPSVKPITVFAPRSASASSAKMGPSPRKSAERRLRSVRRATCQLVASASDLQQARLDPDAVWFALFPHGTMYHGTNYRQWT